MSSFPQLVIGSAIQAFEELCPERIDLIHKNYRKLCSLLADVEEWGQVIIINMLTRYARTQFVDPNQVCSAVLDTKAMHSNFSVIFLMSECYWLVLQLIKWH